MLPGSLQVKDGPFRFWFNRDFQGAMGNYNEGREVGRWKECDRFGHCQQKDYPTIYPDEKQRPGFKPDIPVSYVDGKYIFDFASCRSTWVTHTDTSKPDLELNIGAKPEGCFIAHIPADAVNGGGNGGMGEYNCTIPFQVGKRTLGSLDLISELPKQGLPQYCTKASMKTGPYPGSVDPDHGEGLAQVFTAEFSIGNNGVGIAQARLHFQVSAASRTNRCVVWYGPRTNSLYLLSDKAGKYLGPIAAGGKDSLWNSRCLLSGCSHAEASGDMLKVHFAVRFNPAQFAGPHGLFLEMVDTEKHGSPAPYYGIWTVPAGQSEAALSAWPADRSCPAAVPVPPLGVYTASAVNCKDVSGTWSDQKSGETWSLGQTGASISGSLTITNAKCGSVSWRVAGQMKDGVATLTATEPVPKVDKCGVSASASITATLAPDCNTGEGKVEIKK